MTETPRICLRPGCGCPLVRRKRMSTKEWEEQRYCGHACAAFMRRGRTRPRGISVGPVLDDDEVIIPEVSTFSGLGDRAFEDISEAGIIAWHARFPLPREIVRPPVFRALAAPSAAQRQRAEKVQTLPSTTAH